MTGGKGARLVRRRGDRVKRLAMIFLVIATTLGTAVPALAQGSGKVWPTRRADIADQYDQPRIRDLPLGGVSRARQARLRRRQ
jgi:hypothetical protein